MRKPRPRVFVCYRHEDTSIVAQWLVRLLEEFWGKGHVWYDEKIPKGSDFPIELERHIKEADYFIALIGDDWHDSRRLSDPDDWVRWEISKALKAKKTVIPTLVEGAAMPAPMTLPEDIRALASKQAHILSSKRFLEDVRSLATFLEGHLPPPPSPWIPRRESSSRMVMHGLTSPWASIATSALIALAWRTGRMGWIALVISITVYLGMAFIAMFDRRFVQSRAPIEGPGH